MRQAPTPRPALARASVPASGIGVAQIQPERAVVRHRRDRAAVRVRRHFQFTRWRDQLHEFAVSAPSIFQRFFVRIADHGNEHAVLGLHGEAHVNRTRMNNFAADEPAGGRGIFRQRDRQRAQRVERRPGFGIRRFAMREQRVQGTTGRPTVASGRVQLRRMASATATRMGEALLIRCFSRCAMNFS